MRLIIFGRARLSSGTTSTDLNQFCPAWGEFDRSLPEIAPFRPRMRQLGALSTKRGPISTVSEHPARHSFFSPGRAGRPAELRLVDQHSPGSATSQAGCRGFPAGRGQRPWLARCALVACDAERDLGRQRRQRVVASPGGETASQHRCASAIARQAMTANGETRREAALEGRRWRRAVRSGSPG